MNNMFEGFLNVINTNTTLALVFAVASALLLVQIAIRGYYFINNIIDDREQRRLDNEYLDSHERRE